MDMNMDMDMNGYSYGSDIEYNSEYEEYLEELREVAEKKEKLRREKEEKERIENEKIQAEKLKNELHVVTPFLNWANTPQNQVVIEKLSFEDFDKGWTQVKYEKKQKNEEKKEEKKIVNTNKTEICKYALAKKKCAHKTCRYAHSIVELNVVECNYGSSCKAVRFNSFTRKYSNDTKKDKICMRIHPEENKENFYSRVSKFIPLTEEEMDLINNCIEDFEEKNSGFVHNFAEKAKNLPSNKSMKYIIPTPYYDIHAFCYGTMAPVEENKKVVKKIEKKPEKKVEKPKIVVNKDDETKKIQKIKMLEVKIKEMQEKIRKNNNIYEKFILRIDNLNCQKHCKVIKLENAQLTSSIDNLLTQIEKIKNPTPKPEKKVVVQKKNIEEKKPEKKVEIVIIKKFDTDVRSFKSALNVVSSEPSQKCCAHKIPEIKEVKNEVVKTKTEMCKSYGKYICPLGEKCRFAHSFDELNILSCPYGNKCFDVECCSGEYFNRNNMKNRVCNKKHPGETIENVHKRIGYNKVAVVNKPIIPEVKSKTVLCNSVLGKYKCNMGNNCKFAHNAKELNIQQCAYGDNCFDVILFSGAYINKNNTKRICNKKHPSETTSNVYKRLGL